MGTFNARLIRRAAKPRSAAMEGRVPGSAVTSSGAGTSNVVLPHDHDGQLIRPAVLCIPVSPPGDDAGMREGEYALFLDAEMAVEGEDPSAGGTETEVYRLNGLTALAAGASSSAIENAIGSFSGLLEAVRAGMVIIDAPDAANGERKTAVWAMTSGSILVGMDFHTAPDKVTRYAVTNAASGLTLAIRAYSLLTEDGTLNDLTTGAKTVPGAINELAEKASEGGGTMQWDTWN